MFVPASQILWFAVLFVLHDRKLNMFGFWTRPLTRQAMWRHWASESGSLNSSRFSDIFYTRRLISLSQIISRLIYNEHNKFQPHTLLPKIFLFRNVNQEAEWKSHPAAIMKNGSVFILKWGVITGLSLWDRVRDESMSRRAEREERWR